MVLLLTEWPEFVAMDPHWASRLVRRPIVIDGRNKLDADRWARAGWTVHSPGRSTRVGHAGAMNADATATA